MGHRLALEAVACSAPVTLLSFLCPHVCRISEGHLFHPPEGHPFRQRRDPLMSSRTLLDNCMRRAEKLSIYKYRGSELGIVLGWAWLIGKPGSRTVIPLLTSQ